MYINITKELPKFWTFCRRSGCIIYEKTEQTRKTYTRTGSENNKLKESILIEENNNAKAESINKLVSTIKLLETENEIWGKGCYKRTNLRKNKKHWNRDSSKLRGEIS